MNINDKEKDQWSVSMSTMERKWMRVLMVTMTDTTYTGSEERSWYSISLLCNAISLPWCCVIILLVEVGTQQKIRVLRKSGRAFGPPTLLILSGWEAGPH